MTRAERYKARNSKEKTKVRLYKMKRAERNKIKRQKNNDRIRNTFLMIALVIIGVLIFYN